MANIYDQFDTATLDAPEPANVYDQFDEAKKPAAPKPAPPKLNLLPQLPPHMPSEFSSGYGADVPISENPDWAMTQSIARDPVGFLKSLPSDAQLIIESAAAGTGNLPAHAYRALPANVRPYVKPLLAALTSPAYEQKAAPEKPFGAPEGEKPLPFQPGVPIYQPRGTVLQPEGNAIQKLLSGFTTPGMVAAFPFAETKAAQVFFLAQTAPGAIEAAKKLVSPNVPPAERQDAATDLLINAVFTHGLAKGLVPKGVKPPASAPAVTGENLVMPQGATPPPEPDLGPAPGVPTHGNLPTPTIQDPNLPKNRPVVPGTPAEPRETAVETVRRANALTIAQIQQLFPKAGLNREQARELRNLAWGPPTQEGAQNAEAIRGNQEQLRTQGNVAEASQVNRGGNVEQATPQQPKPVEPGTQGNAQPARPGAAGGEGGNAPVLTPALLVDGKPLIGGTTHAEIVQNLAKNTDTPAQTLAAANAALADDTKHVFVDQTGKVYDRKQAAAILGRTGELHSEDLPKIVPRETPPPPAQEEAIKTPLEPIVSEVLPKKGAEIGKPAKTPTSIDKAAQLAESKVTNETASDNARRIAQGALESAARDISGGARANQTAPEEGGNFDASVQALHDYAHANGKLLDPAIIPAKPPGGGVEHDVWQNPQDGRMWKATHLGTYGTSFRAGEKTALPQDYLTRMTLMNRVFGDDIRFEGVAIDPATGKSSIVTSQPFIKAAKDEAPTHAEINTFMRGAGFEPKSKKPWLTGWERKRDGVVVSDANPSNFIKGEDGNIYPIDVQIRQEKQPWQTTQTDYLNQFVKGYKGEQFPSEIHRQDAIAIHHDLVERAVKAGESVPAEVLADYPDLKPPEPITKPAEMVGMGAALYGETQPNPNSPTSIKNAQVDIERQKRGLPPAMQPARRSFGRVWDEAMAKLDQDPEWLEGSAQRRGLIEELAQHPRATTDLEDAGLLERQITLQNEYGKLTRDLAQAYEDAKTFPNRQEAVDELRVRTAGLNDKLLELYNINKAVGTATARGLSARRMMAFEDYTLAKMEVEKRAANGGRPLTPEESATIARLHARIAELQNRYDDYVAKTANQQAVPGIEALVKMIKGLVAKNPKAFKELPTIEETKKKIGAALQNGERADVSGLVQKLVRAFVEENPGIGREQLVEQVHAVLKQFLPDIERRETMDAISGYGDYKPLDKDGISAIVRDLKGQLQQIGKLEDMAAGEAPKKTGIERRVPSDEERRLIKQVEEAKRKGGYKVTDPAAQLRTVLESVKTRLTNQIKDLEHQIATRQKIVRNKTPLQYDEAANRLKARRDELKSQFDEIFQKPGLTEAQRLEAWKTRTQRRIAEFNEKLAARDFAKRPVRPPPELDAAARKIQAELYRAKQEYQRGLIEDRLKARPWWVKAQDTFLRWYRGGLLSSPVVFAKLTAAALVRAGLTPLEEATGAAIGKAFPKLAARAPREGYWNSTAEARAITSQLTKGPKDAWDVLRTGESDIDILYGKGREGAIGEMRVRPFSVADFPGRSHGAFKASTKRAEFERSLEKRLAYEIRNGVDASDAGVQLRAAIGAYKDANRSIFLQDNLLVSGVQALLQRWEQPNKVTGKPTRGGKAAATTVRTLVPIMRVPSNIVAEAAEFALGLHKLPKALRVEIKGEVSKLSEEDADLIMRQLKKGSIGGAALLIGFLLPQVFGGFYQRGEKRKPSDVRPGQARIPGVPIPKILGGPDVPESALHNPIFQVIQAGATVRRVADKNQQAGALAIPIGVLAAGLGLVEETPYVREMLETGMAFNPSQQNAYFGELAKSITEPQLIQWLAKYGDKDEQGNPIQRKPKTFVQHLEMGIPGLRKNVPVKPPARNIFAEP